MNTNSKWIAALKKGKVNIENKTHEMTFNDMLLILFEFTNRDCGPICSRVLLVVFF